MEHGGATGSGELVGRASELDDIDGLLTAAAGGEGAAALLEGEAGIGRSALLGALGPGARLVGVEPVQVRATVGDPPYAPIRALLAPRPDVWPIGPLDEALAGLLRAAQDDPGHDRPDGAPLRPDETVPSADLDRHTRIADVAAALVRRRGEQRPWVLLLDDAHLADVPTLDVLTRLAREESIPGVLVVLTLRPVPHRAAVSDLVSAWVRAGARNVELRPLSTLAVQTLVERSLGAVPGPVLRGVLATAGGNPQLLAQVLGAARDTGSLVPTDGVVDLVGTAWHAELDRRVQAQVAYLEPAVLALLTEAGVLGTSFVVPDLAALAALDVTTCWRTLRHALAAGVVAARGDRLVFRHDLVRTALYDGLAPDQRRALHARAAWALEAAGAPAHVVSTHLERARPVPDS